MPNSKTYLVGSAAFMVGAFFTFAILQMTGYQNTTMIFIMGTILATATFSWHAYSRELRWEPSLLEKVKIGFFLACVALTVAVILHGLFHPFAVPLVTFVVTPIGVILFPITLLGQFSAAWNKDLDKGLRKK